MLYGSGMETKRDSPAKGDLRFATGTFDSAQATFGVAARMNTGGEIVVWNIRIVPDPFS